MDTILAPMSFSAFPAPGIPKPTGLASRRRGPQSVEPLSLQPTRPDDDNGLLTPRTSRMDMLKGLRTAPAGSGGPKSATSATFPHKSASPAELSGARNRSSVHMGSYDTGAHLNGLRTALPQYGRSKQAFTPGMPISTYAQQQPHQQYTAEQILAPPQIRIDENAQDQIDPQLQAQLLYANAYLSEQQLRLQEQLRVLQAAAQQFEGMHLNGQVQMMPQTYQNPYAQQAQYMRSMAPAMAQPNVYSVYDPATGQEALFVDQAQAHKAQQLVNAQLMHQLHQLQHNPGYLNAQQPAVNTPLLQVSPPQSERSQPGYRTSSSPSRRTDSPFDNTTPLPPPSANAFRRGHKKSSSVANSNKGLVAIATDEPPKSAGPRSVSFPATPATAGFGPGQARAGEHPVRQPRHPPSLDELRDKPTAKHEGSRNFATRTRRSAINDLVRAGMERRKDGHSTGSISPISESTGEAVETPVTDAESDAGSGSGSLIDHDDPECGMPSSRTSTSSYGAIGSERPQSREKRIRNSLDSTASSDNEGSSRGGSFASLLKSNPATGKADAGPTAQRKAPRLVLTSVDKRKTNSSL